MLVKDMVVRDIVAIDSGKDIIDALFVMFSNRRLVLPVFNGPHFAGTISMCGYAELLKDFRGKTPESIRVSQIMDKKIRTVSPTTDVLDVIDKVTERGVYSVPVLSGHNLIRMVTREDVMRQFLPLLRGRFNVGDVMSYDVSVGSIHDTVESVVERIISGDEKRIVIMDYKKVEGIICIKDLVNVLLAEKSELSDMSVKDILVPNTITLRKSDDIAKAAEIILDWWVGGVPVMDGELEGIVKDKDILQRLRFIM